jgi:hypothetical protein
LLDRLTHHVHILHGYCFSNEYSYESSSP